MTRVSRYTCGAGALLGVLLLAAFSGTALTLHYEARGLARGEALDRAAGRIFAAWFRAAHRASQEHAAAFETSLTGGHTIVLTPARLRVLGTAPPGLPDTPGRDPTVVGAQSTTFGCRAYSSPFETPHRDFIQLRLGLLSSFDRCPVKHAEELQFVGLHPRAGPALGFRRRAGFGIFC